MFRRISGNIRSADSFCRYWLIMTNEMSKSLLIPCAPSLMHDAPFAIACGRLAKPGWAWRYPGGADLIRRGPNRYLVDLTMHMANSPPSYFPPQACAGAGPRTWPTARARACGRWTTA